MISKILIPNQTAISVNYAQQAIKDTKREFWNRTLQPLILSNIYHIFCPKIIKLKCKKIN